jgi:uncharacterized membrane protein YhhN
VVLCGAAREPVDEPVSRGKETAKRIPTSPRSPLMASASLKAAPVACLGLWTLGHAVSPPKVATPSRMYWLVGAGLILGSGGDFALELDSAGWKHMFLVGLVFFLCSHVAYIAAFVSDSKPGWMSSSTFFVSLLVFGGFAGGLVALLMPGVEDKLQIPVMVYASVIAIMGVTAASRVPFGSASSSSSYWLALAGALFFVASDAILATNKFAGPLPQARWYIMSTYYAAQILLAFAASERWVAQGREKRE